MGSINKARILLIGSGGVGTIAAYALQSGGQAGVTVVCRSNYKAVVDNGYTIDSVDYGHDIRNFRPSQIVNSIPDLANDPQVKPYDFLVVTTKNVPDIRPNVLDMISPAVTPGVTTIVLLQNGLNIERPIVAEFPDNVVLSCVSLISSTEVSHGVIRHDFRDQAFIGPFPNQKLPFEQTSAEAHRFLAMYNAGGKAGWEYDEDVPQRRWKKLVYNSAFNPVAAILGMDTTRMRMSEHVIDDLVRPIMLEITAIARACGVVLPDDIHETMIRIEPTTRHYTPSMGQDAAKGNFLELEVIVGEPLREAERLGVPAPTLRTIYGILRGMQLRMKEARGLWKPGFSPGNPYQ